MKLRAYLIYGFGLFIAFASSAILVAAGIGSMAWAKPAPVRSTVASRPQRLSATGLFAAGSAEAIRPQNLSFLPQYPLWSDGAVKRR